MQRMDSLDSTNHKIVFKKQNHRPSTPPTQKDIPALFEGNKELSNFHNDRLLIGGFSFPMMSSIPYETGQRQQSKAAEEKVLCAMQQLDLTESELQKTKQQLQIEKQLKTKEEFLKKSLETEIKNALRAIEDNENTIAREIEIRRIAEKKLNETLSSIAEKEHHIRLEAEKTIRDNLGDFIETKKNIEKKFTDHINNLQDKHKEQTLKIKADTAKQIFEFEQKVHFHEKIKIETQEWLKKSEEACRLTEAQKVELENNLACALQNTVNLKAQHESTIKDLHEQIRQSEETISSISITNVALKEELSEVLSKLNVAQEMEANSLKQIESLNLQIQQLKEKSILLENDKNELTTQFKDSLGKSKILQSIANNERGLRVLLEEKLNGKEFAKINHNKKLLEKKTVELEKRIGSLQLEKEKISSAMEQANKTVLTVLGNYTMAGVSSD